MANSDQRSTPRIIPLHACCSAEFLGTFLLVFFGCGAVHVAVLTEALSGLWQVAIVWGVAIMLAIYAFGPVSGAHINPAITLSFAAWRMFPAGRVPAYLACQTAGAFVAAALLFLVFQPFLAQKERDKGVVRGEPGSEITAMCYGEYFPNPGVIAAVSPHPIASLSIHGESFVSMPVACLFEFIGTAILAMMVVAVTHPAHPSGPKNLAPVFIGLTVSALIVVIAPITQACFNPARDFGPRLFASLAGWGEIALPGPRSPGFLTVYILAPIGGAIVGVGVYRFLVQPSIVAESEG